MKFSIISIILIALSIFVAANTILDDTKSEFNSGSHNSTHYNNNALELNSSLSAAYTSKVFDSGKISDWNTISLELNLQENNILYAVDGSGSVFLSIDSGVSWNKQNESYGRTSDTNEMFSTLQGTLYILAKS